MELRLILAYGLIVVLVAATSFAVAYALRWRRDRRALAGRWRRSRNRRAGDDRRSKRSAGA